MLTATSQPSPPRQKDVRIVSEATPTHNGEVLTTATWCRLTPPPWTLFLFSFSMLGLLSFGNTQHTAQHRRPILFGQGPQFNKKIMINNQDNKLETDFRVNCIYEIFEFFRFLLNFVVYSRGAPLPGRGSVHPDEGIFMRDFS